MKIITVSYRLPVSLKKHDNNISIEHSAGGLATAILSYTQKSNASLTWIGIADFEEALWQEYTPQATDNLTIEPVFLDKKLNKGFYNGFSNSVLWALFHYFPSFMEYNASDFEAYKTANDIVAQKIAALYEPGDMIWVHDYHFLGLGKIIRELLPNAKISFFLHIPFPAFELFRILPNKVKRYLLEGMLGSNLVGFHTWENALHFTECVEKILGLSHKNFTFSQETHRSKTGSFPISIDYEKFNDAYDDEEVTELREEILNLYEDKKIIFSVDRLDYSKGIVNRLKAFEAFLQNYPEWHEKVVFLLVLVPSREEVPKYGERRKIIESLIARINGNIGNYKWSPIVYQYQAVSFERLIALYTSANVALISPIRDGMNLVAKEFVASRKDLKGVLMLSVLAGAAKEMQQAITINPFDIELIADKINVCLTMDEAEQAQRIKRMQVYLKQHNVFNWAETFLNAAEDVYSTDSKAIPLKGIDKAELVYKFEKANKRLLLLDFDGTLVNLQNSPELAIPDEKLLNLLTDLSADSRNEVWIVSGRDKNFLQNWMGHLPIGFVAEHGGYIKRDTWQPIIDGVPEWKDRVIDLMKIYVDTNAESFIEVKEFGVAWHYRRVDEKQGFLSSRELLALLKHHLHNTQTQIIDGNKVIEVKHYKAHKGTTCKDNILCNDHDFGIAIGDDKTDEDLFEKLTGKNEFAIKVGTGPTAAQYRLASVEAVLEFLNELQPAITIHK